MSKHRQSWSQQQKLQIISFYKEKGIGAASAEFGVSSTTIYNWEKILDQAGESGLESIKKSDKDLAIKRLEREIRELRNIVADNALELRIKDELLKKSQLKKS
jgi:transposase-like protein